jgi:hypothetical protein
VLVIPSLVDCVDDVHVFRFGEVQLNLSGGDYIWTLGLTDRKNFLHFLVFLPFLYLSDYMHLD